MSRRPQGRKAAEDGRLSRLWTPGTSRAFSWLPLCSLFHLLLGFSTWHMGRPRRKNQLRGFSSLSELPPVPSLESRQSPDQPPGALPARPISALTSLSSSTPTSTHNCFPQHRIPAAGKPPPSLVSFPPPPPLGSLPQLQGLVA